MKKIPKIIKSQNDNLNYSGYILKNKLKVIFIQDSSTKKSSIVFRVSRGSFSDPKSHNGIAHFLEHMLFMGSKKYPLPDDYREFINSHGGSTNAWTDTTSTVYYHSINKEKFLESFDMINQFFCEPLINKTFVDKEINIVNSEFEKNKQNDVWRENHLFKHISYEDSFYNTFSTGNLDSLRKDDVYDKLVEFWKNEYSANLMNVVVYHNEDVEKNVLEFLENIENKNLTSTPFTKSRLPFDEGNSGKFLKYKSIKKETKLKFNFFIKSGLSEFKNPPSSVLSFLIGHESEGSIHSLLVEEGLIYSLSCGNNNYEDYFANFMIVVLLTEKGKKNIPRISEIIFSYINMLKKEGIPEYIVKEIKTERGFQFKFQNKVNGLSRAQSIVENMAYYPLENINNVGYLMEEYTPELYKELLDQLKVENLILMLSSNDFETLNNVEPIYGSNYSLNNINEELKEKMKNPKLAEDCKKKLHFPPHNYFLPEKFDIMEEDKEEEYPIKIFKENSNIIGDLYHKLDHKFKLPKVLLTYKFITKSNYNNLNEYIMREMWKKILIVYLKQFLYLAEMGRIELSFTNALKGLSLVVSGYSDKIDIFMKKFADKINEFIYEIDEEFLEKQFIVMKKKKLLEVNKLLLNPPYNLVLMSRSFTFLTNSFCFESLAKELNNITFEDYKTFHKTFLNSFSYDALHMGNLTKSQSLKLNSDFINELISSKKKPTKFQKMKKHNETETRAIKLKPQKTYIIKKKLNSKAEKNDCILITYQYKQGYNHRHALNLLAKYIESFCFDELRTQKELGYIVFSIPFSSNGVYFFQFLIQSDSKTSMECAGHIYEFIKKHRELIKNLKDDKFESYKTALINALEQEFNNIYEEKSVHWNQIGSRRYEFDSKIKTIEAIKNLKKSAVLQLYEEMFFEMRKVLETHYVCEGNWEKNNEILELRKLFQEGEIEEVGCEEEFKRKMGLYPDTTLKL